MSDNLYEIGYNTYEESTYDILTHKCKYSNLELEKIVQCAVNDILQSYKSGLLKLDGECGLSYQDIHPLVVRCLIENYDFQKCAMTAQWSCFGWPSILDPDDWKGDRQETLERLTVSIPDNVREHLTNILKDNTKDFINELEADIGNDTNSENLQ